MSLYCYWDSADGTLSSGATFVCVEIPDEIIIPPEEPPPGETDPGGEIVLPDGTVLDATGLTAPLSGVKQMAWQGEPWNTLWLVRTDGQLCGLTYDLDEDVWGFHRHPRSNGACMSIDVIPAATGGVDELWAVWRRMVGGVQKHFIERMGPKITPADADDKARYCFLDSALSYGVTAAGVASGDPAITIVKGLDHLLGETVRVWADAKDAGEFTVVAVTGGVGFVLPEAAEVIHAGIHTNATLISLPTAQLWTEKQTISEISVIFENTLGGKAGRSPLADELERIDFRSTFNPMEQTPPLWNGFHTVKLGGKHDTSGIWCVVQDYPGPMTILAAVPTYVSER